MRLLSFVIPCYGSEHTIEGVVNEIVTEVTAMGDFAYEIILINDCSPDCVWSVIEALAQKNKQITGICLAKNFGQHAALMAGYSICHGDIVVSLDDDGQSPVNDLHLILEKMDEGYDVVYGYYPQIKQNRFRVFGSLVNEKMTEALIGKPKGLKVTSYYAAKRFIVDEMVRYKNAYPYVGGLVFRSTRNVTSVPVNHRERLEGRSGYTFKKLLALWFNGFTAFSEKPLRLATYSGVLFAFIGFVYGIYTVLRKLLNPAVPMGYSSLLAVVLFSGGMIMLLLGIIGEYVGRIYISINAAPQYVIREITGDGTEE